MKLKTLKDLEIPDYWEIRKEAIKWVKYYRKNSFNAKEKWLQDRFHCAEQGLKNFFNITEEELE